MSHIQQADEVPAPRFGSTKVHRAQFSDVTSDELVRMTAEATAGDIGCQYVVGAIRYERGDYAEAARWWRKSALAGHLVSAFHLGTLVYRSRRDRVEAERWWRQAAVAGHVVARHNLGSRRTS